MHNSSSSSNTKKDMIDNNNNNKNNNNEDDLLLEDLPTLLDDNFYAKFQEDDDNEEESNNHKFLAEYAANYITKDIALRILRAFENSHGLIQAAIDSYNHFMNHIVPEIIYEKHELFTENPRKLEKIIFRIDHVHIEKPTSREDNGSMKAIFPNEARLRRITYAASVYICFQYSEYYRTSIQNAYILKRSVKHKNKLLCKIPVMVKSHFCNLNDYPEHHDQECTSDPEGILLLMEQRRQLLCN